MLNITRYYEEAIKAGIAKSSITPESVRAGFKPGEFWNRLLTSLMIQHSSLWTLNILYTASMPIQDSPRSNGGLS